MRDRTDTRAVLMLSAVRKNRSEDIVELFHDYVRLCRPDVRKGSAFPGFDFLLNKKERLCLDTIHRRRSRLPKKGPNTVRRSLTVHQVAEPLCAIAHTASINRSISSLLV